MSAVATAIQKADWEAAAVCLLWGFVRAASKVPPEALQDLLDALEDGGHGSKG